MTNEATPTSTLDISVSADGHELSLTLVGEVDPHTAPRVEGEIRAGLLSPSVEQLLIDLAGVTFMDSSGLRVLISAHRSMRERGGRLVLRSPSPTVSRLLEITQLGGEIDIHDA
jgi:stage II sporulation protein AA (anti-sigma F factor antagonist)